MVDTLEALDGSAASHHYLYMDAEPECEEVKEVKNGPAVKEANKTVIKPHLEGKLPLAVIIIS